MGEESVKKSRDKRRQAATAPASPMVVCVASSPNSNNIELGLLISLMIVGVYIFGCYEAVASIPDVSSQNILQPGNWYRHMGENLNVARSEFDAVLRQTAKKKNGNSNEAISLMDLEPGGEEEEPQEGEVARQDQVDQEEQPAGGWGRLNMPIGVPDEEIKVPKAQWPPVLRTEVDDDDGYEDIIHSGDGKTVLHVPRLWSLPVHNYKLMSRELAMKIGSCAEPDADGNVARGDDCPRDQRTIYVGIASFRDFECRTTVESIFLTAKNPRRVRVGVVDQIVNGEDPLCNEPVKECSEDPEQALCKYIDQVDVFEMDAGLSIGPVFARHIGYRLYRGEYYATQSDAHVTYTKNWDADIIDQFEQTGDEMAVLSTYLSDVQGSIDEQGHSTRNTRPIMCNTGYEGGPQGMHLRHGSQPEMQPSIHGTPQLQPWWAAGYSFSRGHFVVNVPYDPLQPMIFQGEEMSIGLRGFTVGYDFYAPERSVCFHHYAVGKNKALRSKVKHFWDNGPKYAGVGKKAMARLLGIVHMNPEIPKDFWNHEEEDIYGIGAVRTPENFFDLIGIDVKAKTIEGHLCTFVNDGAKMHKLLVPKLRSDGMGIDYSGVTYKFKDPRPGED